MLRAGKNFFSRRPGGAAARNHFTFPSRCYENIKYMGWNFKREIFALLGKYTSLVSEMPKMR